MPTQRRTAKSATKTSAKSSSQSAAKGTTRSGAKSSSRAASGAGRGSARKSSSSSARGTTSGRGSAAKRGAAKKGTARARRAPDALELLTEDHRNVQKMFRKAERLEPGDPQLQQIIEAACAALTEHAELEERLFYPALREQADAEDLVEEAQVEHDVAKDLIAQLQGGSAGDERTKAMFKVLGEYVNHHIEEEEGQIFRKAKRAKMDLVALGQQIMAAKQGDQLAEAGDTGGGGEGGESKRSARRDASEAGGSSRASRAGSADDDADESRGQRSGRASGEEDAFDEEVDVETPGARSGSSRSSSRPTSH